MIPWVVPVVSPPVAECGVSLVSSVGVSFLQPSMRDGKRGGGREGRRERGEEGERGGGEGSRADYKSLGRRLYLSLTCSLSS